MPSLKGLFDFEFSKTSIFDPEVNQKGIFDFEFSSDGTTVAAVLSGTFVPSVTEADVVAGGKTTIITLTGDTWIAAGAGRFDLQRAAIIAGFTSRGSETFGWNLVPKALQRVSGVVRTSNTVVTITWDAFRTYDITAPETVTCTVPGAALVGGNPLVATPTFTINQISTGIVTALKLLLIRVGF